jgi:peptide/nickel transport system substrate-binding protein
MGLTGIAIAREQFYVIGTVMVPEGYGIKRNDFHNVPSVMPESADYNDPAPTNPEQYFIQG